MSGAEVILAILPLLISAAEHWEDCLRPFKRFCKFSREVKLFQQHLKLQHTIFRNQCRILLENVTQSEIANQMLAAPSHPSWSDLAIDQRLIEHLAESKDACVTAIELIEERLRDVRIESDGFGLVTCQDSQNVAVVDKAWRNRVAKKLRFSFSKSRLEDKLSALRSLNDDFRTLSSQAIPQLPTIAVSKKAAPKATMEVQKCRTIGKASRQVYEALGKACTKHTDHLAMFNPKVEHGPCTAALIQEMRFNIAFTHLTLAGLHQLDPIWFVVDSRMEDGQSADCNEDIPRFEELTGSLKRQTSISQECVQTKPKKRVRFQSTSTPTVNILSNPLSSTLLSVPSIRRDFCDYLRRLMNQSPCKPANCMALLEATNGCKHLVYPSPLTVSRKKRSAVSLQEYISSCSRERPMNSFPQYQRLQLAKALSTAVLQYHGTPWIKLTWRSQDVVFFDDHQTTQDGDTLDLSAPHLNVAVHGPNGQDPLAAQSSQLARNAILFGLGVMLLEIAYSATLGSLQQPSDLVNGSETEHSEYFAAKRLSNSIGREMGPTYGKIVKKLLHCDFGCGDDLNDPELQARYYTDVVCELDRLEKGFRQLQVG